MKKKKRTYPSTIKYTSTKHGPVIYEVIFADLSDCVGKCDPNSRTITIQRGMGDKKTLETFVHELLHLVEFEEEIPNFTHWHIRKLDMGLTKLLMDNFL